MKSGRLIASRGWIAAAVLIGAAALWTGCQPTPSSPPNTQTSSSSDLPKTYPAAIERLDFLTAVILDAATAGDPGQAHDELHEIGHVIQAAPKLAEAGEMPSEDLEAVRQASDQLFGAFDTIDGSLHGRLEEGETLDMDALGTQVDEAMAVLQAKTSLVSDEPVDVELEAHDDHDQGDHDHGDHDHGEDGDHEHEDEAHSEPHNHDAEHAEHDADDHEHDDEHDGDHDHEHGDHDHGEDVGDDEP